MKKLLLALGIGCAIAVAIQPQEQVELPASETSSVSKSTITPIVAHPKIEKDGYAMRPHVLYFTAKWCPPCVRLRTHVDKLRREGYRIYGFYDKDFRPLARTWNVRIYPTFVFMREGREQGRLVSPDAAKLRRRVEQNGK
jgi:thioredoxin 1